MTVMSEQQNNGAKDANSVGAKEQRHKTSTKEFLKQFQAKKAIKGSTLVIGLLLIVFMTVTDIVFDPSKFDFFVWLSKTLILVGISVFGLLMGESIGKDKSTDKDNPDSLYQTSLAAYKAIHDAITPFFNYFGQYYIKSEAKELRQKKISFLVANGFDGDEAERLVDNLTKKDVDAITHGPISVIDKKGCKIGLCQVNEDQGSVLNDMIAITLDAPNYAYFLSANANIKQKGTIEKGVQIPKERVQSRHFNRIWKISFTIVVSVMWSFFTVQDFMAGDNTQAWMNLISRLAALFTSFLSGWGSSTIDAKLASEELDNKTILLTEYQSAIQNKEFIPEDYEAKYARQEKEAEARRLAEEAAKKAAADAVITPEVMKSPKMIGGNSK
jgi:SOS response regulatory protein OraA/RecX